MNIKYSVILTECETYPNEVKMKLIFIDQRYDIILEYLYLLDVAEI